MEIVIIENHYFFLFFILSAYQNSNNNLSDIYMNITSALPLQRICGFVTEEILLWENDRLK